MNRKSLPLGMSDFKKIIENNCYYIDKTKFIEDILKEKREVILCTRPRRFGKTLNLSMMKYFFDIEKKNENKGLFDGLYISSSEYMKFQGEFPVIHLTFKDVKNNDIKYLISKVKTMIRDLFSDYTFVRESLNESQQESFDKILKDSEGANFGISLKLLSNGLYNYYGKKVVLLLDEYDTPIISCDENNQYKEGIRFFQELYSEALKDNEHLETAVVTGILRVAKESIFSGLNNLVVDDVLTNRYSYYGLTEEEVESALEYYGLSSTLEETQKWYNGYTFGKNRVYNPWSILNHCSSGDFRPYWINTSGDTLIRDVINHGDIGIFESFQELANGNMIEEKLLQSMTFDNKYSSSSIWYLMVSAGYLTIGEEVSMGFYTLRIPNFEVKAFFSDTFISMLTNNDFGLFNKMIKSLNDNNIIIFEKFLQDILLKSLSYFDTSKEEEKFYHNLMLGLLLGSDRYFNVTSNQESGYGRYDVILEPKSKDGVAYIMEFKIANKEKDMEKLGKEAITQIDEKNYEFKLREKGYSKIEKLGIVFFGKKVKVFKK